MISACWRSTSAATSAGTPSLMTRFLLGSYWAPMDMPASRSRGCVTILADLLDQRIDAVELALAAQPLDKFYAQVRAVDVFIEIDDVAFDREAAAVVEGRPHTDIGHGWNRSRFQMSDRGVDPRRGGLSGRCRSPRWRSGSRLIDRA